MVGRIIYCVLVTLFIGGSVRGQSDSLDMSIFNNDSIQYELKFITPGFGLEYNPPAAMFYVKLGLRKKQKALLLKQPLEFWMSHLRNDSTDWATNLILYNLLMRNANEISVIYKTRQEWLKFKEDDISYWHDYITKNGMNPPPGRDTWIKRNLKKIAKQNHGDIDLLKYPIHFLSATGL